MTLTIFSIRDSRNGVYGTPIFAQSTPDQLKASYRDSILMLKANCERAHDSGDMETFGKLAAKLSELKDAVIYDVGTFDNSTGRISIKPEEDLCFRLEELCDFSLKVSKEVLHGC